MLCVIVDMLTVLVLSGSTEPGLWQVTQYCVSLRRPPWNSRPSWQALQVSLSTISRLKMLAVAPDEGCQV